MSCDSESWKTKPTDRFVLKWVKCHLSARVTPKLLKLDWLRPGMITVCSAVLGVLAGVLFGIGWGFAAGVTALMSQVADGVDGQFARLTSRQSATGALLDSALDRYADGSLMIGGQQPRQLLGCQGGRPACSPPFEAHSGKQRNPDHDHGPLWHPDTSLAGTAPARPLLPCGAYESGGGGQVEPRHQASPRGRDP